MKKQTIIDTLFYGGMNVNGRPYNPSPEQRELSRKIEKEMQYFMEKMAPEDCERLGQLEELFVHADTVGQQESFACGLKLGILLMCEVLMSKTELMG